MGDAQSIAQGGPVLFCDQGRLRDREVGAGRSPVRPQERRDVGPEGGMDGFIRGLASRRWAPEGDGTIDTQRGEDALLQGGALVLL